MCEPVDTAQSHGDDTHAVATGLCGDASTDYASSVETARMLWYFVRGERCVTSIVMCSEQGR